MWFVFHAALVARGAPPLECGTLRAIEAARGERTAFHPGVLRPPFDPTPDPPASGKGVYGGRMDHHVDSANFTVAWADGDAEEAEAEVVSDALEEAWDALLVDRGWTPPASSDEWLLWVILDPDLDASSGYTTEYSTDDYPDGYPVIYLNPAYADYGDFWPALAMHEFHHAIQMTLRDWWTLRQTEFWYWEASANWAAELVDPDLDAFNYMAAGYTLAPWYRYDSTDDAHDYGMFVFNAWLEEQGAGPGAMKAAWELSTERAGEPWDGVLAECTGQTPAELWGGFSAAIANGTLADADSYEPVAVEGTLTDGIEGEVDYLGTHYFEAESPATLATEDDVVLAGPRGVGSAIQVREGDVVGVTGLVEEGATYRLALGDPEAEGDTGTDGADTGEDLGGSPASSEADGCGCGAPRSRWGFVGALSALAALALRRRSVRPILRTRS